MSVTLNNQDGALDEEEQDDLQDWLARPLVCDNEREYWKFWIWLYGRIRESE